MLFFVFCILFFVFGEPGVLRLMVVPSIRLHVFLFFAVFCIYQLPILSNNFEFGTAGLDTGQSPTGTPPTLHHSLSNVEFGVTKHSEILVKCLDLGESSTKVEKNLSTSS